VILRCKKSIEQSTNLYILEDDDQIWWIQTPFLVLLVIPVSDVGIWPDYERRTVLIYVNAGFSPGWRPNLLLSGVAGLRSGILSDARPLSGMGISVRCVAALLNSLSITSSPFLQVVIQHSTILSYSAIHAIRRSMGDIPQASGKRNFVSISAISRCMCLLRSSVTGSVSREKRCIP